MSPFLKPKKAQGPILTNNNYFPPSKAEHITWVQSIYMAIFSFQCGLFAFELQHSADVKCVFLSCDK